MDCGGRTGRGFIIQEEKERELKCFGIVNKRRRGREGCQDLKGYPARWGVTWWFK